MVYNDRPTCKDRHAAELIMARRDVLHLKAEYIAADLSIAPKLFPCSPAADHTLSLLIRPSPYPLPAFSINRMYRKAGSPDRPSVMASGVVEMSCSATLRDAELSAPTIAST